MTGTLTRATRRTTYEAGLEEAFRAFVLDPAFPCLAGKGVLRGEGFRLRAYGSLGSGRSTGRLAYDLRAFLDEMDQRRAESARGMDSFVAVFPRQAPKDEIAFEQRLWQQLQLLHRRERPDATWDPTVSNDPDDPHFSYSFAEHALFVIGMHPASSRLSRRFAWPTLVFNPHAQFEALRADGRFKPLQAAVRDREVALQGSVNPNLADFGDLSDARQYSGRPVGDQWKCPFHQTLP